MKPVRSRCRFLDFAGDDVSLGGWFGSVQTNMSFETSRLIPSDHPGLPGHFPDAPIVPGVVVLDEVLSAVAEWRSGASVNGIPFVKFLAPIPPDQSFTIVLDAPKSGNPVDFCCRIDGRVVVEGRLEIGRGACI